MPKKVHLYNIFIASPSDSIQEREVTKNIIYEWNSCNFHSNIRFEPVLWEMHARPDYGRGQEIINQQLLNKTDIAIVIFKHKLGNGTLEEIDLFQKKEKPIMVFFSSETVSDDIAISDDYHKLLTWKKEVAWNSFLADSYSDEKDLKEKLFKNLFKLRDAIENDENFILTQKNINFTKKEISETYNSNSNYEINKDKQRLKIQAKALEQFDISVLDKVIDTLRRNTDKKLKVLDVGCSDGYLTVSRFNKYDNIEVLGIDIDKNQIAIATSERASNKFRFEQVDITNDNMVFDQTFDIIFSAYTLHHLKNSDTIISKLWDSLNTNGVMLIRSPDDDLKVNFPYDEELDFLLKTTDEIAGSSDRKHGRKLYTFLKRCRPIPTKIEMKYFIQDTCGLSSEDRLDFFEHYYGYRNKYANYIAKLSKNPDDIILANKLNEIIEKQKNRFEMSSEIYSVAIAIMAIAYKGLQP